MVELCLNLHLLLLFSLVKFLIIRARITISKLIYETFESKMLMVQTDPRGRSQNKLRKRAIHIGELL